MPRNRRGGAWILIALLVGVVLHFVPPLPSGRPAPEAAGSVVLPAAGLLALYDLDADRAVQHKLPKLLEEVSGLAMTSDGRLLAHNDEVGLISEVDTTTGDVLGTFAIVTESEPIAGDFEGIAVLDDRVYLATSDGVIYECPEGTDGQSVACDVYATGLGAEYELEGLGSAADSRELILVSKNPRSAALRGLVCIDRWSTQRKQLVAGGRVTVSITELARPLGEDKFQPSGVELDAASGNYLVLAAVQKSLAEVTPQGRVLAVAALPKRLHSQPEGIAFAADGSLLIADEGADGAARLTRYPRREQYPPPQAPRP